MFCKLILFAEKRVCQSFRRELSTRSSWDILTGVCIERLPVVTPPLNEIQKKYLALLKRIEVENSFKSDHEVRHEHDKVQAELISNDADIDLDTVSKITAQDFEDAAVEELAQFKLADIETEADRKGDKASIERCLQHHLVMVAPQKVGKDTKSLLPQGHWQEGETLRQTAERIVKEQCGPELKVKFLGNAPCGFYKYKYPTEINGRVGAKVFFYYANYEGGLHTSSKDKPSLQWLTRRELTNTLPERYYKSVNEFLIHESY